MWYTVIQSRDILKSQTPTKAKIKTTMKIVICEDCSLHANTLRCFVDKYFKEINCPVEIAVYKTADGFLKDLSARKIEDVQVAFLDIYMPGTNGVDAAKKIRQSNKDMVIVFATSSTAHGLDGYEVDALQYLVKPVDYAKVKATLKKCAAIFADHLKFIEVLSDRLSVRIYLKEIIYVESFDKTLFIHTTKETFKTFMRLPELEKRLAQQGGTFLRTHRSYLLNMNHIKRIDQNDFIMQNNKAIPIRKADKLAIKQVYRDYLFSLAWSGEVGGVT